MLVFYQGYFFSGGKADGDRSYGNLREHRNEKTAEIMMRTYFESDRKFLQTVELERFKDILRVMKLTEEQFDQVNYCILWKYLDSENGTIMLLE